MQVLDDGVVQLQLCQYNGPIIQFLDLDTQEITNFLLVIEGEILGAVAQISHHLINGFVVVAKDDVIIDVHQEDDRIAVIQARVELVWGKTDCPHPLVHVLVPHSSCLRLPLHVVFELEHVEFSGHVFLFVSLWQS